MTDGKQGQKSSSTKDVIYIDVEDDITGIVEKVRASSRNIVALVLPKRSTMLQSIVNMKLLKRASETSKKNVVLITTEAGLLPLAGSAGLHVAKSLQTKPEVPEIPASEQDKGEGEPIEEVDQDQAEQLDKSKTLDELAGDDQPIELDNMDDSESAGDVAASKSKPKKGSKIKIPNFNKFRLVLLLGGGGVLALIGLIIWAFIVLPKAEVVISTDSSAISSSREMTLATAEDAQFDADQAILPAQKVEESRTQRAEVAATGEENRGEKAAGSVTMSAKDCSSPFTAPKNVPAGSGLSAGGNTYITQSTASFELADVDGGCAIFNSDPVKITAQTGGTKFNVNSATFSVAGRSDVSASGSAKGGTDNIVKIVSQQDIDKAKEQIAAQEADDLKQTLSDQLSDQGLYAITETFNVSASDTDVSAEVGDEVENVTVTEEVIYSMLGVDRADLERAIAANVADKIDQSKQTILDYGLAEATFTKQNEQDANVLVGVRSVVVAGPDLNVDEIKKQIAGLKANDARSVIEENPGVTNVDISYGPFWVKSIPGNTSKITVTVEEPESPSDQDDE